MTISEHMTTPEGAEESARRLKTPAGMAHWQATGPIDKTCRECLFWSPQSVTSRGYWRDGRLAARRCKQYEKLIMGRIGSPVVHTASACKFFCQNPEPPPLYPPIHIRENKNT
jgi:hypothetical protein